MQNSVKKCSRCNGAGMTSDFLGYCEYPCDCRRAVPYQAPPPGDYPPLPKPAHPPYIDDNGNVRAHGGYSDEQLMLYLATDRAQRIEPALEAPAAPMTTAEACAALAINSALHRIRSGNADGAIEPLEHAKSALAAAPQAPEMPEPFGWVREPYICAEEYGRMEFVREKPYSTDRNVAALYSEQQLRAALAAAPQAPDCARCSGSGEDPEGYLTHGHGPNDHTVDGPCRSCDGTGAAPQAPAAPLGVPDERSAFDAWFIKSRGFDPRTDTTMRSDAWEPWKAWQARAALAATPAAAPVVPKWIDDPHDIEQGQMLNPEWVKVQEVASAPAAAAPVELPEPDALVTRKIGDICSFYSMTARKGDKLYSEQQVRALLAQAAAPAAPDLKRENANLYEALAWWRRDAKIRGAAARLLMENLSDEDRLGDGRINTTRVRELLEPITRDTDEQSRDLGDSPATAAPAALDPRTPADMLVNGGALKLALNVLRRAGKNEVADELEKTAAPAAPAVDAQAGRDVLEEYRGPDDTPHPVLLALSEHDSPCDDTAEAIARIAALRAEIEHLRPFLLRAQAHQEAETDRLAARPSATTLNVLRVALERGNMPYRSTGFKDHEIATAAEWVRAAQAKEGGAA